MLIRYEVSNFLSFKGEIEFSMIPGRTRKHPGHIVRDDSWNGINVLKSAVIYGANASGKSNLVKSMSFLQDLVLLGTKPRKQIEVPCFRFDESCANKPTTFQVEMKIENEYYAYGCQIKPEEVLAEWLYSISKSSNKMLFERASNGQDTRVEFGKSLDIEDSGERQFLEFVARGTRSNQLFLTESIERNVSHFEHIFDWFENTLTIVFPDSRYMSLDVKMETDEKLRQRIEHFLKAFNTGISGISLQPIDWETDLHIPEDIRSRILKNLEAGSRVVIRTPSDRRYMVHKKEDGQVNAYELVAEHKVLDTGKIEHLEMAYESDGTQRLLDLIPGLVALVGSDRVFVVDELDRSLHPALSYELIETFLKESDGRNSQLIVTTHETGLLDLDLLRRDEVWFVEKDRYGSSSVYSLEEFVPRQYNRDIRRGYLEGRFGGIPIIHDVAELGWS